MQTSFPYSAGDRVQIKLTGAHTLPFFYHGKEDGLLDLAHLGHQKFTFSRNHYAEGIIEDNIGVENEGFVGKIWGRKQRVLLYPFYYVVLWSDYYLILPAVLLSPNGRRCGWVGAVLRGFLYRLV